MRRFFNKLALFLAISFLLSILIQLALFGAIRKISVGDFGVLNAISRGDVNAEMLICGSSRAYVQYDPEILEGISGLSCYNIGINGSGMEVQLAVLKWYLDKNTAPRVLLQNIDVFGGEKSSSIYQPYRYLPYLGNRELYRGLSRIDKKLWIHRFLPISNLAYFNEDFQKGFMKDVFADIANKPDYLYKGYSSRPRSGIDRINEEMVLKDHAAGFHYRISPEIQACLADFVSLCREHEIRPVFVIAPEYIGFMNMQNNRSDMVSFYRTFSEANGIDLIDYSESEICLSRDYFYNFTHLNAEGSRVFSKDLADKLVRKIECEAR